MANKVKLAQATSKVSSVQTKLSAVMALMSADPKQASRALRDFAGVLKEAAIDVDLATM